MKTALIYLAAGSSRRFGSNKLLHPLEGKPLYLHLLEQLIILCRSHKEWEILVVSRYPEIMEGAEKLRQKEIQREKEKGGGAGISVIASPHSEKGMSETIKAALGAAGTFEAYAFFVADQPYLKRQTVEHFLERMEEKHKAGETGLGCVGSSGHTGNPVWFSASYREELLALTGDKGGKEVLKAHGEQAWLFPVTEEKELQDMDEP